jgi:hypothetical protein
LQESLLLLKFTLFALACFVLTFTIAMLVAAIIKAIGAIVQRRGNNAAS